MAHDKDIPAQLDYERHSMAKACRPLVQESYKITIALGTLMLVLSVAASIWIWDEDGMRSPWRSWRLIAELAVLIGAMFISGVALVWLGHKSGRRSSTAAYWLCGIYALAAMPMIVIVVGLLKGSTIRGGDDHARAAVVGTAFLSCIAASFLWLAWAQWSWAKHIAANREA